MRGGEWLWSDLFAAGAFLGVGILAALRARRSQLAPHLARTSAATFAYEIFEALKNLTGHEEFEWLEYGAAALIAPTFAALIIRFLGDWRRLRWLVVTGASYFTLVSLLSLSALFIPQLRWFPGSDLWAGLMLAGMAPEFGYLGYRLFRHARAGGAEERARTQLLVIALVLGVGGAATDLIAIAGSSDSPRLSAIGLVASALVLAALALRFELMERVSGLVWANVAAIAVVVVLTNTFASEWLASSTSLFTLTAMAVTIAAVATVRPVVAALSEDRARTRSLATMGRFSAQMAHDLRNPLAAIRGAAQFLAEERARGGSLDPHAEFVALILEQADRLDRVVGDYQRLGRAEAVRAPVELKALLDEVAAAQRVASSKHAIDVEVPDAPLEVSLDRDLVVVALENLIRNAREAAPQKGRIVLSAKALPHRDRVLIAVSDDGPGMDARTRERALDDFFTTKSSGSGLGLAFVSRVALAHGGTARVESEEGKGTKVSMELRTS